MTQIKRLMIRVRELCAAKGWREKVTASKEGYEFPAYIALAHSELAEALEAYRDKTWSSTDPVDQKPIGVGPELADVVIRVLDICDIWHIDIESEINRVIDYGWTRPYQHGGRIL